MMVNYLSRGDSKPTHVQVPKTNERKAFSSFFFKATMMKKKHQENRPSTLQVWVLAARPHTLTASIAPVLVSWAVIKQYCYYYKEQYQIHPYRSSSSSSSAELSSDPQLTLISILFAIFACLIQLGTNLHNDYADYIKGADTDKRVGHSRATQRGWLSPFQTAAGSTICLAIAFSLGLILTYMTGRLDPFMIFVTISSVFNAFCYTGGEYPLGYIGLGNLSIGYSGLGDVFVFLYFGLVATVTVPYIFIVRMGLADDESDGGSGILGIFRHELFVTSLIVALPIGFLATGIIVVNNLRDRLTDIHAGKNTLAVRFGEAFARIEYMSLVLGSYWMLIPLSRWKVLSRVVDGTDAINYGLFLPLLSFPKALVELKAMGFQGKDGAALNQHVGGTAKVQLLYCVLLVIGLLVRPSF
jgi:1,4-dihydroxy-2-naphthoate octaprenyltransferase